MSEFKYLGYLISDYRRNAEIKLNIYSENKWNSEWKFRQILSENENISQEIWE
jgi:hypothetical protein